MMLEVHKKDIALQMLFDAKSLFNDKKYYSALNLAASASEVLCKLCIINGLESPHSELKSMMGSFHRSNQDIFMKSKDAMKAFNSSKNSIKHLDGSYDQYVSFDPKEEALLFINQATKAASVLDCK